MVSINNIGSKLAKGTRKFVSEMSKDGFAPIILLESAVVAGRTYQAHKRGGFVEARERATEESLGSVFWLGGVVMFSKLGDFVGKKIFKVSHLNFDVGRDAARKPFENYLNIVERASKIAVIRAKKAGKEIKPANIKRLEAVLSKFKFVKIISSILLANTVMGFIVPKLNQKITKNYQKSIKTTEKTPSQIKTARVSIEGFANKKSKNVSFDGLNFLSLANAFESDARLKLVSTDVGTASGRAANARNKNERTEILFRDITSMYFYYLCKKHLSSALNYLQDGRATRLDPVSAKQLDEHLSANLKPGQKLSSEEFLKLALGDKSATIPDGIQAKLQVPEETVRKIQAKYKDAAKAEAKIKAQTKIISIKDFEKIVGKDSAEAKIARQMSKLQPEHSIGAILTEAQVKDVYTQGLINDPKFLNKVFRQYTDKASTKQTKFVSEKELAQLKTNLTDYVKDIAKKANASKQYVTLGLLKKVNKLNFLKNTFNLGAGFAVAALFLSTVIPKVQYWITRKQTGQDKFPGVE